MTQHEAQPFVYIQIHSGSAFVNQIRGEVIRDPRGFFRSRFDRAASAGYPYVMIHSPAGVTPDQTQYAADQRALMDVPGFPRSMIDYLDNEFAADLAERDLGALGYLGMAWQREWLALQGMSPRPPLPPVIKPNDPEFDDQITIWRKWGFERLFFDATGTYSNNRHGYKELCNLRDALAARGLGCGMEALPMSNATGEWNIDVDRAREMPSMIVESQLAGWANNDLFRVPTGAIAYDVMTPKQARQGRIHMRQRQGYIVCPWDDVPISTMKYMLKAWKESLQ